MFQIFKWNRKKYDSYKEGGSRNAPYWRDQYIDFFFIKTKMISEPNYKADATLTI